MPPVVLLDLKMPNPNGLQVLKKMRAEEWTSLLPGVFTSSREDEAILHSYALQANSYVRKPVEFEEFSEATRQLGLYWVSINEPVPPRPQLP